ncbi:MAG: pyroglutamyl-peptidase I [Spirochaetes bacterium]|nr:pyroglutamyl-peptidase I [Spirochaetota bacterium]
MKVLVTGFGPFGGERINSSLEVIRHLPRTAGGARLEVAELPVVYGAASRMLRRLVALERPACVISLGLAGGRRSVPFDARAVNLDDARIPDNDGNRPSAVPAVTGAPATLPPTLPLCAMLAHLRAAGIPVEMPRSAGTFLCNQVFYHLVDYTWRDDPSLLAGFVHLRAPYLELEVLVRGIVEAVGVLDGKDAPHGSRSPSPGLPPGRGSGTEEP